MGDFIYNGEHSITIDPEGLNINTWKDWHMAPQSRPFVSSPPVKEEYVDVPGADGSLDYTDALTGKARYGRRTGSWNFVVDDYYKENWPLFYSEVMTKIHGKHFEKIILDDDPDFYYKGRLSVSGAFGNRDYNTVQINYNFDPYKWPIGMSDRRNWAWNELFGLTIFFGSFSVVGMKLHDFLVEDTSDVEGSMTTTTTIKMYILTDGYFNDGMSFPEKGISSASQLMEAGYEKYEARALCLLNSNFDRRFCNVYTLVPGENKVDFKPGHNVIYFVGNGVVKVSYKRGKTL